MKSLLLLCLLRVSNQGQNVQKGCRNDISGRYLEVDGGMVYLYPRKGCLEENEES